MNATNNKNKDGKPPKLNVRQYAFVKAYRKHFDPVRAYEEAGYTKGKNKIDCGQRARRVFNTRAVQAELDRLATIDAEYQSLRDRNDIAWIRGEHKRLAKVCEEKELYSEARQNIEALGRTIGAYKEGLQISVDAQREYDELERIEGKRLAKMMAMTLPPNALPVIDAEIVGDNSRPDGQPAKDNALEGRSQGGNTQAQGDISQGKTPEQVNAGLTGYEAVEQVIDAHQAAREAVDRMGEAVEDDPFTPKGAGA